MEGHRKTLAAKNDDEQRGGGRNNMEKEHDCVAQHKQATPCSNGLSAYAALRNETNSIDLVTIDFVNGERLLQLLGCYVALDTTYKSDNVMIPDF